MIAAITWNKQKYKWGHGFNEYWTDANLTNELVDTPGAAAIVSDVSIATNWSSMSCRIPDKTNYSKLIDISIFWKKKKKRRKEKPWGKSGIVGSVVSIGAFPEFFLFLFFAISLRLHRDRESERERIGDLEVTEVRDPPLNPNAGVSFLSFVFFWVLYKWL